MKRRAGKFNIEEIPWQVQIFSVRKKKQVHSHTCPNKIFSGLIQPIPHAFPMDEEGKPDKVSNFAQFARKRESFVNRTAFISRVM